jgi:hypothetical protein
MSHTPDKQAREKLYTIRLSEEEDGRARRLSAHLGVPISTMLRMWLLEKERELGLTRRGTRAVSKSRKGEPA